jgi:hypothetical protein
MGKWMDLALQLEQEAAGNGMDNRDVRDVSPPIVAIVPNVHAGPSLPPDLIAGLDKLRTMRPPRIQRPELWVEIVRDGLQVGTHWASQAISLGWPPLYLFGCEPSSDPDQWDESLAVQLAGRVIRAVDADRFYLRDGDVRSIFERRPRPGLSKFLWEL